MLRRGHRSLVEDLHLAIYARTFGKPLEWGYGGPKKWAANRPYNTPDDSQDQIGFRTFDWYAATAESVVGKTLPMIVGADRAIASVGFRLQFLLIVCKPQQPGIEFRLV
jgi:hypothetical protein